MPKSLCLGDILLRLQRMEGETEGGDKMTKWKMVECVIEVTIEVDDKTLVVKRLAEIAEQIFAQNPDVYRTGYKVKEQ